VQEEVVKSTRAWLEKLQPVAAVWLAMHRGVEVMLCPVTEVSRVVFEEEGDVGGARLAFLFGFPLTDNDEELKLQLAMAILTEQRALQYLSVLGKERIVEGVRGQHPLRLIEQARAFYGGVARARLGLPVSEVPETEDEAEEEVPETEDEAEPPHRVVPETPPSSRLHMPVPDAPPRRRLLRRMDRERRKKRRRRVLEESDDDTDGEYERLHEALVESEAEEASSDEDDTSEGEGSS